jgi:NADH-quinone oxidoreductase subunit M
MQNGPELTAIIFTAFAALGVIFAAGYLLWMWRRVMFGPIKHEENKHLRDLNARELGYMVPMVLMAIIMGVFPNFFISRMEPSTYQFLIFMSNRVTVAKDAVVVERPNAAALPEGPLYNPNGGQDAE